LKILITGASGLLGYKLAKTALNSGHQVYSAYNTHPVQLGIPIHLDITDGPAVERFITSQAPSAVVHTASVTDVDFCEQQPELAMRVNGFSVGPLARSCRKIGSFLVYVSTDYVFDGKRGNYAEDDETNPANAYGRSKLLGENQTKQYAGDFLIARTSVVYGLGREHRPNFATWLLARFQAGAEAKVAADQFSSPTLNTELAKMILEAVEGNVTGIMHLAGATRASRLEFAVRLAEAFDFDPKLVQPVSSDSLSWKAKRPPDSSLDVTKASETLNNKPLPLDEALRKFRMEAHSK